MHLSKDTKVRCRKNISATKNVGLQIPFVPCFQYYMNFYWIIMGTLLLVFLHPMFWKLNKYCLNGFKASRSKFFKKMTFFFLKPKTIFLENLYVYQRNKLPYIVVYTFSKKWFCQSSEATFLLQNCYSVTFASPTSGV